MKRPFIKPILTEHDLYERGDDNLQPGDESAYSEHDPEEEFYARDFPPTVSSLFEAQGIRQP